MYFCAQINLGYTFSSARANEFAARATGGVRFVLGILRAVGGGFGNAAAGTGSFFAGKNALNGSGRDQRKAAR